MFIVMAIYLIADPSSCREERLSFAFEGASPMACVMAGQQMLAQWQEGHPEWKIDKWRCVPRDRLATRI